MHTYTYIDIYMHMYMCACVYIYTYIYIYIIGIVPCREVNNSLNVSSFGDMRFYIQTL